MTNSKSENILPPSRYATRLESLSEPFMKINQQIIQINKDYNLGDLTLENRARFPWARFLEFPAPYASRLWEYPWAIIEAQLKPGMLCADVGSGQTPFTLYLKDVAHCHVVGFDSNVGTPQGTAQWGVSQDFIEKTGIEFVNSDIQFLNWADNSFDRVFCISVIEHIHDSKIRNIGMKEIARILKPGGLAIISVDVNIKTQLANPLELVWDSGLSFYGKVDLFMPKERFGIYCDGEQPADVFGFILQKSDAIIQVDYGNDSNSIEAWKVGYLRESNPERPDQALINKPNSFISNFKLFLKRWLRIVFLKSVK